MQTMKMITDRVRVATRGNDDVVDLTGEVQALLDRHGLQRGQALIFVSGSTAGLTTIEFEPGLV